MLSPWYLAENFRHLQLVNGSLTFFVNDSLTNCNTYNYSNDKMLHRTMTNVYLCIQIPTPIMNEIDFPALQSHILAHRFFESDVHGLAHWQQVERNGLLLATETEADTVVVRLFALFHDSKRRHDGPDILHGARGAEFAKECFEEQRLDITQEQFDKLYHACKFHTAERRSGDATIDTCYDADRLDLGRVGMKLDPGKMATTFGARIAQRSLEEGIKPENMREWLSGI